MSYFLAFLVGLGNIIKFAIFHIMLFIRPLVVAVLGFFSGMGLFFGVICYFIARDHKDVMWILLKTGFVTSILLFSYDWLLSFFAPEDVVLISQR